MASKSFFTNKQTFSIFLGGNMFSGFTENAIHMYDLTHVHTSRKI